VFDTREIPGVGAANRKAKLNSPTVKAGYFITDLNMLREVIE
jgi:hypothetical protein